MDRDRQAARVVLQAPQHVCERTPDIIQPAIDGKAAQPYDSEVTVDFTAGDDNQSAKRDARPRDKGRAHCGTPNRRAKSRTLRRARMVGLA